MINLHPAKIRIEVLQFTVNECGCTCDISDNAEIFFFFFAQNAECS